MSLLPALQEFCSPHGQDYEVVKSSNCAIILEPHYIGHGNIGGIDSLDPDRVDSIVEFFSNIKDKNENISITVYIPGEEMVEFPKRYMLTPSLWQRNVRGVSVFNRLISARKALEKVFNSVTDRIGLEYLEKSFRCISRDSFKDARAYCEEYPELIDEYALRLKKSHPRYRLYSSAAVHVYARWKIVHYLAIIMDLKKSGYPFVLGMEADTSLWDVAYAHMKKIYPELSIWWAPEGARQHFT